MANRGLNIEGRCENKSCEAYQQWVICPKRFEAFNLMHDDIKCPMCRAKVKPQTCGFYDCAWKFDGTQTSNGFSIISLWQDASGYKYHRFKSDEYYGSVEWESLLIVAKPRDESIMVKLSPTKSAGLAKEAKCTLCWSTFGLTKPGFVITIGCGHSFHCSCIDEWSGWCSENETLPSCPVCRQEVEEAGA